jgi:microcystin-dependent protein
MASEPLMSQIQIFAFDFPPRRWAKCDGTLLSIATNSALFSLLGTTYGGDGRTTFGLPDLRSRMPKHFGNGPGLASYGLGEAGGVENVALLTSQMPLHTHTATTTAAQPCQNGVGDSESPAGKFPAAHESADIYSSTDNANIGAPTVTTTINPAGGSQPHPNLPPYLTLNFCIATAGIFPSRN